MRFDCESVAQLPDLQNMHQKSKKASMVPNINNQIISLRARSYSPSASAPSVVLTKWGIDKEKGSRIKRVMQPM